MNTQEDLQGMVVLYLLGLSSSVVITMGFRI